MGLPGSTSEALWTNGIASKVQAILGHSSSKVTERYAHLSTKTLQDAANSASARLNGVKSHG